MADSLKKFKPKPLKEKKAHQKSSDRLKVVVRRLPPNLPEDVFWQSVHEWVSDDSVSWKSFYGGKFKKRLNKENVPSRAYIAFKNEENLAAFSREYDGHIFRDKAGNESQAVVEFAPYQKVPPEKGKADNRIATIEADEDYISFLESLKEEPVKPFDVETLESLIASTQPPPEPKTTPLIEALIAEKSAQRDKEAILRNHAHYKDQAVTNGASSKHEEKKKGPSAHPPSKQGELGKKAAKKAAAAQKAQKAQASGQAGSSTTGPPAVSTPTIMSRPVAANVNAGVKSPPRAPRGPKAAVLSSPAGTPPSAASPISSVTTTPPAPAKRARPVIGIASRQFEVALNGAGVKSKRGGKEREQEDSDAPPETKLSLSDAAKTREENMNARIDNPIDESDAAAAGSSRGGNRGRGRARGRGGHRGG